MCVPTRTPSRRRALRRLLGERGRLLGRDPGRRAFSNSRKAKPRASGGNRPSRQAVSSATSGRRSSATVRASQARHAFTRGVALRLIGVLAADQLKPRLQHWRHLARCAPPPRHRCGRGRRGPNSSPRHRMRRCGRAAATLPVAAPAAPRCARRGLQARSRRGSGTNSKPSSRPTKWPSTVTSPSSETAGQQRILAL